MKRRFEVIARFWVQVDSNDEDDGETTEEQFIELAKGDAKHLLSDMVSVDYACTPGQAFFGCGSSAPPAAATP